MQHCKKHGSENEYLHVIIIKIINQISIVDMKPTFQNKSKVLHNIFWIFCKQPRLTVCGQPCRTGQLYNRRVIKMFLPPVIQSQQAKLPSS